MHGRGRSNIYFELFIAQIIILGICLYYINHVYKVNILPDKQAKEIFLQTDCYLAEKKLSEKGDLFRRFRADFLVNYRVNEVSYSHWVSGNGLDFSYSRDLARQQAVMSQYDIGITYSCWYDPEKPEVAILVSRHSWTSAMPLILPVLVGLISLLYALKSLFFITVGLFKEKN